MKKNSFSKFVTLRYLKIVRFPITHLVFLESPQCKGCTHWLCDISLEEKLSFTINKKTFATILTIFSCKNWLHLQEFFF